MRLSLVGPVTTAFWRLSVWISFPCLHYFVFAQKKTIRKNSHGWRASTWWPYCGVFFRREALAVWDVSLRDALNVVGGSANDPLFSAPS